jgi:hypothetical protein
MPLPFTLLIDPEPADSTRTDFADTFHEIESSAPALRVAELSTQRGDGHLRDSERRRTATRTRSSRTSAGW